MASHRATAAAPPGRIRSPLRLALLGLFAGTPASAFVPRQPSRVAAPRRQLRMAVEPSDKRGRGADRLKRRLKTATPKPDAAALAAEAKAEMARRLAAEKKAQDDEVVEVEGGWEYVAAAPAPPASKADLSQVVSFMNQYHIDDVL